MMLEALITLGPVEQCFCPTLVCVVVRTENITENKIQKHLNGSTVGVCYRSDLNI